jgi:hypothetical protein
MKIGIGIARGLKYLHTELEPPFTISELNSSAIYLTEDFSPKACAKPFLKKNKIIIIIHWKRIGNINKYLLHPPLRSLRSIYQNQYYYGCFPYFEVVWFFNTGENIMVKL